jgi:hypothetical protein
MEGDDLPVPGQEIAHGSPQNPLAGSMHHLYLAQAVQERIVEEAIEQRQHLIDAFADQQQPRRETITLDPAGDDAAAGSPVGETSG